MRIVYYRKGKVQMNKKEFQNEEPKYYAIDNTSKLTAMMTTIVTFQILAAVGTMVAWMGGIISFGYVVLSLLSIFIWHLVIMLLLNALYNLQQIRMNSDQQLALLKEIIKDDTTKEEEEE